MELVDKFGMSARAFKSGKSYKAIETAFIMNGRYDSFCPGGLEG